MGFSEGDHEAESRSQPIVSRVPAVTTAGRCHADCDRLAEVVSARRLLCTLAPVCTLHSLEGSCYAQPTLKGEWLCSTSRRVECLRKLFGTLLNRKIVLLHLLFIQYAIFISMEPRMLSFYFGF